MVKWNITNVTLEATKFSTRSEFAKRSQGAFKASKRLGIYNVVCKHMTKYPSKYTLQDLKKEALKYNYRIDFQRLGYPLYRSAMRQGLLDEVCIHMESHPRRSSDNDSVYIWEVVDENHPNTYKIGITSQRLGDHRIKEVSDRSGLNNKIIIHSDVTDNTARELEDKLLLFGEPANLSGFGGSTEFRVINKKELIKMIKLIETNTSNRGEQ